MTSKGSATTVATVVKGGGVWYGLLYTCRAITDRLRDRFDERLAAIERKKGLVEPWTISARRFTAADLRRLYNEWDWSSRGEEWTISQEWKQGLIDEFMLPNIPRGGVIAEIGPGGGRWTEILQTRASKLFVTDVADQALANCRQRFAHCTNIEYLLGDGRTLAMPDSSIDALWSYDVFVHINPVDAKGYFREIARVLKPGGRAVIHHPGSIRVNPSRSDLTDQMVREFCAQAGLKIVQQTTKYAADKNPGDMLTIVQKPA